MNIINTTDNLPPLKTGEKQKLNKKKLLDLAEKVGKILKKEGKTNYDEDYSPQRNAFSH